MNNFNKKAYKQYADDRAKKTPTLKKCLLAFIGGGIVCCIGEGLFSLYSIFMIEEQSKLLSSVSLIFLSALLTGLGWFDNIAKLFGAGVLVPITGFANAVAASAIDNKSEGFVSGIGAKMFIIAGSVVVYGVTLSVLYGIIYYIYQLFI